MVTFHPLSAGEAANARHADLTATERANLDHVLNLYRKIIDDPDPAFDALYVPHYRDHASSVPTGDLTGLIAFLGGFRDANPDAELVLDRALADRDLVFLQSRGRPVPYGAYHHVMEVFRLESGRVAEHWEVTEPPSDTNTS